MRIAIILVGVLFSHATLCIAEHCTSGCETNLFATDVGQCCHSDCHAVQQQCCQSSPPWGLSFSDVLPMTSGDCSLQNACIQPDIRRNWSLVGAFGYETFRGVADQGWQNDGLYAGLNFGTRLGSFSDLTGIGFQIGGTFGVYDWSGNPYRTESDSTLRQDFVSYGFFKRATNQSPITLAVTQDWMLTDNATTYGLPLDLSQIRFRAGLVTSASNEFGVVGAFRVNDNESFGLSRDSLMATGPGTIPDQVVATRPLNHISAYWHHKWFNGGPNTIISVGVPEDDRVTGHGSLGDFLATASVQAPFSDAVGLFGMVMYMNPSATPGFEAGHEDTWSFTIGIEFFPGKDARTKTIAGERWMPLAPVANNGVFLLDAGGRPR